MENFLPNMIILSYIILVHKDSIVCVWLINFLNQKGIQGELARLKILLKVYEKKEN